MRAHLLLPVLALCAAALVGGCGGAGGGASALAGVSGAAKGRSRLSVKVAWPTKLASRVIPRSANSMRIELWSGGVKAAERVIASPATSAEFLDAPVGPVEARVKAYNSTDATGIAVAAGAATGTFADGQNATVPVTLVSTIVNLEVYPTLVVMDPGDTVDFDIYADDADQHLVPTDPADFVFTSSNPASASVDTFGVLTRKPGAGDATITVREVNSNLTATIEVYAGF